MISEKIRNSLPNLKLFINPNPSSFKAQFKKANKLSAQFAIIIGENEVNSGRVTIKSLNDDSFGQKELAYNDFVELLSQYK